jgi:hypothetical protein
MRRAVGCVDLERPCKLLLLFKNVVRFLGGLQLPDRSTEVDEFEAATRMRLWKASRLKFPLVSSI